MIPFKDAKGIKLLFGLILFGLFVSVILIVGHNTYLKSNYPKLDYYEKVCGEIENLVIYQSVAKVELENRDRFMIIDSRNYQYDPYMIKYFLKKGDHLIKKANNDTLIIQREGDTFIFVIGKDLNTELKSQFN